MIEAIRESVALASGTSPVSTRIEPDRGWASLRLEELWHYRELLYFLIWRDVKLRYKQTLLGVAWAIIQPLFTMLIFSLFFGRLAGIPSDGVPYPLFVYSALVPWTFFANSLSQASNSLVANSNLLTKVYVPRLTIPIAAVASGLLDFALGFVVLVGMMVYFNIGLTILVFWAPCLMLLALAMAVGAGLWFSALNVRYRDVRFVVPFALQCWMFATPIAYPSSLLPEKWRMIYGLNPMAGVVEGFRWALLGTTGGPPPMLLVSSLVTAVVLVAGVVYFRRMELTFADVV